MWEPRRRRTELRLQPPLGITWTTAQEAAAKVVAGNECVYLCGPPGSGKTALMDALASTTPANLCLRLHLADYFRLLHRHTHEVGAARAVDAVTAGARLVCLDEFHLHDVADAVLLARALDAWEANRVRVVATSNYGPERLLPNPLFHTAAEPVIALVRRRFDVVSVDDGVDHRMEGVTTETGFASGSWSAAGVPRQGVGDGLIVGFDDVCDRPLSALDCFDLLERHRHLTVLDLPSPDTMTRDAAQRFANLVDACYDLEVRLDLSGPGRPHDLRRCPVPPLDVERTVSRLMVLTRR